MYIANRSTSCYVFLIGYLFQPCTRLLMNLGGSSIYLHLSPLNTDCRVRYPHAAAEDCGGMHEQILRTESLKL